MQGLLSLSHTSNQQTNARLAKYADPTSFPWNFTTTAGSTIQTALDFALTVSPGNETASELYPNVAAVASAYGDPTGKYAAFLKEREVLYPGEPYFLWDQPFSDSGLLASNASNSTGSGGGKTNVSGGESVMSGTVGLWVCVGVIIVSALGFGLDW